MLEGSGEERELFIKFVKKVFSQKKKVERIFSSSNTENCNEGRENRQTKGI